jgi:hypothetical protein
VHSPSLRTSGMHQDQPRFHLEAVPCNILSNLTMGPIVEFTLNTKASHRLSKPASCSVFYRFLERCFIDNILCRKQSCLHSVIGRVPGNTKSVAIESLKKVVPDL